MGFLTRIYDKDLNYLFEELQLTQLRRKNVLKDSLVVNEGKDKLTGKPNREHSELVERYLAQINSDLAVKLEAAAKSLRKK